jgi:hypothetical protein
VVRRAGFIVAAQGIAGFAIAAALVIRGLGGADQSIVNGFGTAIWFAVVGAGVLAAGWALFTGRRWGRGLALVAQLLLLPAAWSLTVSSNQPVYGIPVAVVALATMALLFSKPALNWVAEFDKPDAGTETR